MNINRHGKRGFPCGRAVVVLTILASGVLPCHAGPNKRWDFDKYNDKQGWTVSPSALGVVMGGSLWVALNPKETDPAHIANPYYQALGDGFDVRNDSPIEKYDTRVEIASPHGLDIAASTAQQVQVRMRVLNLSPATDLFLRWRSKEQAVWSKGIASLFDPLAQSRHCALISDLKRWQEVTCYVDEQWHGVIDQIGIDIPWAIRGDLWISSVEIALGPTAPLHARPDVTSSVVVPIVTIPGISQVGFADAFKVLDKSLVIDVPLLGLTHPFMSAGGYYHPYWFPWDSSLALCGAKWVNQGFTEGVMQAFHDVQGENPDGRFDIVGSAAVRGQPGDVSQIPALFEVAYDVARRTSDLQTRSEIYQTMQRYLEWWLSPVKRDIRTGLISGVFDEAFSEPEYETYRLMPQVVAPVNLNVAVAVGAARTADLAADLGKDEESKKYRQVFADFSRVINKFLWDEQRGAYYSYDLLEGHLRQRLLVSTFDPLRLGIASPTRRARLIKRLVDPTQFNWGKRPLTSLAMTDPAYVEAKPGANWDDKAWNGDLWIYHNMQVVTGLDESGRADLAADLNWATIREFHMNYREFLQPASGEGQGAQGYTQSASLYIAAIIEHLFGVDFDHIRRRLRIEPHVPKALYGKEIALENLIVPSEGGDAKLSLHIKQSSIGSAKVTVNISGPLPAGTLEIALPGSAKKIALPVPHSMIATFP